MGSPFLLKSYQIIKQLHGIFALLFVKVAVAQKHRKRLVAVNSLMELHMIPLKSLKKAQAFRLSFHY
jgi:hypothetical protein